ncbi:MAG TPA: hypothetical protein VE954_15745 [Oligoflexus sp.]|uniref:hypothetical protein n=1 Tax=Oligoflexus sp. TaxID=1971216 RepID=UPI002D577393|nr:hypothetical protein [Oligoflexus sp.]HYX34555.1 hypothetical protein [Oligoflexus sp.]
MKLFLPTALLLSCVAIACNRNTGTENRAVQRSEAISGSDTTTPSTVPSIQQGTLLPPESVRDIPLSEAAPPRQSLTDCADPNVPDEDKISAKCAETGVGRTNPIPPEPSAATASPSP